MTTTDTLNYGRLMEQAMRGVLAEVLAQVAETGLPGDHHFYITFDTTHPGVVIADWLRERYPREMMIVMQDWFDDLAVMGDRFQVTLNFSNQPETLVVPLDSVKTFIDPSVKFGLKFDDHEEGEEEDEVDTSVPSNPTVAPVTEADASAKDLTDPEEDDPQSADVVSLDTFRKP